MSVRLCTATHQVDLVDLVELSKNALRKDTMSMIFLGCPKCLLPDISSVDVLQLAFEDWIALNRYTSCWLCDLGEGLGKLGRCSPPPLQQLLDGCHHFLCCSWCTCKASLMTTRCEYCITPICSVDSPYFLVQHI